MRGGALTLVALLVATITLPAPAGAAPPHVVHEYGGHFEIGCAAFQQICPEDHFYPLVSGANYMMAFTTGGPAGDAWRGDIEICAIDGSETVLYCANPGSSSGGFIPAGTMVLRVRLPGTLDIVPDVAMDYLVWLSCGNQDHPSSEIYC